jgi:pyruvate dehydrogenase E1 component beta subunit
MPKLTLIQAINLALKEEMARDPAVLVLGEDVGKNGGVFRATEGLYQMFGEERSIDTPLAESGIVGASIGLAVNGFKPVAEIQFEGFTFPAIDQLVNHASRLRNRSRGKYHVPLVVRFPYGGGIRALEHHSDSPEAFFCHIPGLKVAIPSNPYDAKGLLLSAIRDPDPVIFMEPKRIYRAFREEVPEGDYTVPLGQAKVAREGTDVTLVAWGAMVRLANQVAEKLAGKRSVEVVDLRTLSPVDEKTVLGSVSKTGRCVIVHEAARTCGFGAELIARIQAHALLKLQAPVLRVTGYDVPVPLPRLEGYYLPNEARVIQAIEETMAF